MLIRRSLFLVIFTASLLSACGSSSTPVPASPTVLSEPTNTQLPLPTVTPACISDVPVSDDIDRTLGFTGDIFSDWQASNALDENRVSVSWTSIDLGAAAYIETLIFPCGYEDLDLDKYFNDEYWNSFFAVYQSHELLGSMCQTNDGLRLYEFSLDNQGYPYLARYWAKNDTDHRVITFMLAFPVSSSNVLDEYTQKLFPQLPNCS
jgi:hypothetical protein